MAVPGGRFCVGNGGEPFGDECVADRVRDTLCGVYDRDVAVDCDFNPGGADCSGGDDVFAVRGVSGLRCE